MPKQDSINKVLVIGSGPIVIGQAAEFDYAGTQACLTLKEEGCEVLLINNNPATMMTDEKVADKVYFEPLTVRNIEMIIQQEHPDGIVVSVSGQTGLNLAFKLQEQGLIEKYHLQVLGTTIEGIKQGEDRNLFRDLMCQMNEPIAESAVVDHLEGALQFSERIGYPIIVRPAYTLGGSGGGIAADEKSFINYVRGGLRVSPIQQCLIEKSIAGWKELEFEVIRDKEGHVVVVCHMENVDPVGIHTGDSIVVAPIQTLAQEEIKILRKVSLNIVQKLGIIGACNVQLAFEPKSKQYVVIEVNPRVSRSSALASKATGYPIAKIATKLGLGYTLAEMTYGKTSLASFEPSFDYKVVKFPCFPFAKLRTADRSLGTQMKATGEVMTIEKTVAAGLQKAIRSLESDVIGTTLASIATRSTEQLRELTRHTDDRRFFAILELLRRGEEISQIHQATNIDCYFLQEMYQLVKLEAEARGTTVRNAKPEQLIALKQAGFTNTWLAKTWKCQVEDVVTKLHEWGIQLIYQAIQAYTEQTDANLAYYYSVWDQKEVQQKPVSNKEKILVIGSGPISIGQGVEFDYCSVQGIEALKQYGYETVLINNNPATVSTDYERADKLYFEPITVEDVLCVMKYEQIDKAIVQFGGQTAINLVQALEAAGVELLGSKMDVIDMLEDRERFYHYVQTIGIPHIPGVTATSENDLKQKSQQMGYPILIRPSYVIGGKGMRIIESESELERFVTEQLTSSSYPILIDAYYPGVEAEVDVITDGQQIIIPAILEHIEKAGVHSGDSMAVAPPITLSHQQKRQIVSYAEKIAQGMDFKGIFNIQFVIYQKVLYVLEVNPRASRTVPVMSKITSIDMIELATRTLIGKTLPTNQKILPENDFYTVKVPVYSSAKLPGVDPVGTPEMKSTGEVMAAAPKYQESLRKALIWNEQLQQAWQQKTKEVYLEMDDQKVRQQLIDRFARIGITVKTFPKGSSFQVIEDWMKSDDAFAIVSTEKDGTVRQRAQAFQLIIISQEETALAYTAMSTAELVINRLKQLQITCQKEGVFQ